MSAITPQNAISQVNRNMLNKLNVNTAQNQTVQKAPAPKISGTGTSKESAKIPNEADTLTIAGKTIKKKTAVIGAAAIFGVVLAIGVLIKNGIKKGKSLLPGFLDKRKPNNRVSGALEHNKPQKTAQKVKKKPMQTNKKATEPVKNTPKQAPKQPKKPINSENPEIIEAKAPEKTLEQIKAEIEAEAKRRTEAELKRAETSRIAQDYFFDLNDQSTGKSAKESAIFLQKSLKLDEKGFCKLSEETKNALSREFKDYLALTVPSTNGQMKQIARNAAKMETEFTPDEIKKLTNSKFHIKSLLGEYLKGIEKEKDRAEIIEFLHEAAKLIP